MENKHYKFLKKEEEILKAFFRNSSKMMIIGLGNEYRMDDGAGILSVRLLKKKIKHKTNTIIFLEAGRKLINHLYLIEKIKPSKILFIDVANLGLKPGTIKLFYENQLIEHNISTHENNLTFVIAYIQKIIPNCKILFIGIQFQSLEMTDKITLSDKVEKSVEEICTIIDNKIKRYLNKLHV